MTKSSPWQFLPIFFALLALSSAAAQDSVKNSATAPAHSTVDLIAHRITALSQGHLERSGAMLLDPMHRFKVISDYYSATSTTPSTCQLQLRQLDSWHVYNDSGPVRSVTGKSSEECSVDLSNPQLNFHLFQNQLPRENGVSSLTSDIRWIIGIGHEDISIPSTANYTFGSAIECKTQSEFTKPLQHAGKFQSSSDASKSLIDLVFRQRSDADLVLSDLRSISERCKSSDLDLPFRVAGNSDPSVADLVNGFSTARTLGFDQDPKMDGSWHDPSNCEENSVEMTAGLCKVMWVDLAVGSDGLVKAAIISWDGGHAFWKLSLDSVMKQRYVPLLGYYREPLSFIAHQRLIFRFPS